MRPKFLTDVKGTLECIQIVREAVKKPKKSSVEAFAAPEVKETNEEMVSEEVKDEVNEWDE